MQIRYVNTASTAGGDGTTNNTAGATRAYATLREALLAFGLTTLSDAYTIYCEGSAADTSDVDQDTWNFTTSPTNYLLVTTQGAQRHQGVYDTGIYRLERTNSHGVYGNAACHVRIDCLQCKLTTTGAGSYVCFKMLNLNQTLGNIDCRITNCIAWAVQGGGGVITGFVENNVSGSGVAIVRNCIAIDCNQGYQSDRAGARFYNCGAYDGNFGFIDDDGGVIVKNCLVALGADSSFVGTFGGTGTSNNAEDIGSGAPGTSSHSPVTFTFVNAAADDFHLAAGDAGAQGLGVDLSGDANWPFSDDIDGETRTGTWDIGPDQVTDIPPISDQAETLHVIRSGIRLR